MKTSLIRRMASLEKALLADRYEVTIKHHIVWDGLIFTIKLKEGDEKEIRDKWGNPCNIKKVGG